jgi:hypothetical protein
MKVHLDMNKIARGLRAERKGKVVAGGGYFGAMQLLADIETRLRVPAGGGRATDPDWTERRLVPLAPRTLKRLEAITEGVRARSGVSVEPMQLAALLLEKTTEQLNEDDVKDLVTVRRRMTTAPHLRLVPARIVSAMCCAATFLREWSARIARDFETDARRDVTLLADDRLWIRSNRRRWTLTASRVPLCSPRRRCAPRGSPLPRASH